MVIYTIGHSTRSLDDFVGLLHAHGVRQLNELARERDGRLTYPDLF